MSNKRPAILMGILLLLLGGYLYQQQFPGAKGNPDGPPLPGANSISSLVVKQDDQGRWFADYDYFYTGRPVGAFTGVRLLHGVAVSAPTVGNMNFAPGMVTRGQHHVRVEVQYPYAPTGMTTEVVQAQLGVLGQPAPPTIQTITQRIDWPDWRAYQTQERTRGKSADDLVAMAIAEIDGGDALDDARSLLELAIARDARADAAYVELARVTMKSNWSTEGLHQAEGLVNSALQIRPDSVNAKILLAYIEAHQGRYQPAQALYAELEGKPTPNLWLWSNWGEMLTMQGHPDAAVAKYREAIARPATHGNYDRARVFAYEHAIPLLTARKDVDGAEALYRQRLSDYGASDCSAADYARFELIQKGDITRATELLKPLLNAHCDNGDPTPQEVMGLASYMAWAADATPAASLALNQAHVYMPVSARTIYMLASNDRSIAAARKLIGSGESVDQRDNRKLDALSMALAARDLPSARRLIKLGARVDAPVGAEDMPVALIPAFNEDVPGIRLMQQSGADYTKLRFRGVTAVEAARRGGRTALATVLDTRSNSL